MKRRGITLLEIVLALGLAAVAMSLLAQLVAIGSDAAASARDRSTAQVVAESVMAEFTSGVAAPVGTSGVWEADPMWAYDVSVASGTSATMNVITVTVAHNVESARPTTFSLTQWLAIPPDPVEEDTTDTEVGL